jgi:hypothetical protein
MSDIHWSTISCSLWLPNRDYATMLYLKLWKVVSIAIVSLTLQKY